MARPCQFCRLRDHAYCGLISSKCMTHSLHLECHVCKFVGFLLLFLLGIPHETGTNTELPGSCSPCMSSAPSKATNGRKPATFSPSSGPLAGFVLLGRCPWPQRGPCLSASCPWLQVSSQCDAIPQQTTCNAQPWYSFVPATLPTGRAGLRGTRVPSNSSSVLPGRNMPCHLSSPPTPAPPPQHQADSLSSPSGPVTRVCSLANRCDLPRISASTLDPAAST